MNFPIEELKRMLDTGKNFVSTGSIIGLFINEDNSDLIAQVSIFDDGEDRVIEARVTWQACSMGSGIFQIPTLGDGVVVVYPDAEDAEALIIARMTNEEDKIPEDASDGHLVVKSLKSRDLNLWGGGNIKLGKIGQTDALEEAVLGKKLIVYILELLEQLESLADNLSKDGNGAGSLINAANYVTIKEKLTELKSTGKNGLIFLVIMSS